MILSNLSPEIAVFAEGYRVNKFFFIKIIND